MCFSGGGRRAVVDAGLDGFLCVTCSSNEGFHSVELPLLQADVVRSVALANDASHLFRLGSGLPDSFVKFLHGLNIARKAFFRVLSTSFEFPLDSGLASSRACLQGQGEDPLQHVDF